MIVYGVKVIVYGVKVIVYEVKGDRLRSIGDHLRKCAINRNALRSLTVVGHGT